MLTIDILTLTFITLIYILQTNPKNITNRTATKLLAPHIAFITGTTLYILLYFTTLWAAYLITSPQNNLHPNLWLNTATLTITILTLTTFITFNAKTKPQNTFTSTNTIKIATSNTLWTNLKPKQLAQEITNQNPDIIFLQEYSKRNTKKMHPHLIQTHPHYIHTNKNGLNDLATYSKHPLLPHAKNTNHIQTSTITINNETITLINIHTTSPTSIKRYKKWLKDFQKMTKLTQTITTSIIMAGDFNATAGHYTFRKFLTQNKLNDLTTGLNTWSINKKYVLPFMHLDHIVATKNVKKVSTSKTVGNGTDHCPVYSTIQY